MQNKSYAGFFIRFAAYLLDILILSAGYICTKFTFSLGYSGIASTKILFNFGVADIVLFLFSSLYFILLTYFNGQTIGKMVFGIRVVNINDEKLSIVQVVVREVFAKYLSKIIAYAGYFMIGPDSKKRALHDRLSDTLVIFDEKNEKN